MTTVAKADKSRLTIRGVEDGQYYLVIEQPGGWLVRPERSVRARHAGLTPEAFATLWENRERLGADTAEEVLTNMQAAREASRAGVD